MFKGTTLRSMLLNAYGWWQMGQIALISSVIAFIFAGITLVLSGLGLWHFRKVPVDEEIPRLVTTGFASSAGNGKSDTKVGGKAPVGTVTFVRALRSRWAAVGPPAHSKPRFGRQLPSRGCCASRGPWPRSAAPSQGCPGAWRRQPKALT